MKLRDKLAVQYAKNLQDEWEVIGCQSFQAGWDAAVEELKKLSKDFLHCEPHHTAMTFATFLEKTKAKDEY